MTRHPPTLIVELAANAPAAVVAAAEEAIRVVAPLATVELVRVPPQPGSEELRICGPLVACDARVSTGRPQLQAMAAFAVAFDSALAAAGGSGDGA
jgi:hypothetical protein